MTIGELRTKHENYTYRGRCSGGILGFGRETHARSRRSARALRALSTSVGVTMTERSQPDRCMGRKLCLPQDKSQVFTFAKNLVEDFAVSATGEREFRQETHGMTNLQMITMLYPLANYMATKGARLQYKILDLGSGSVGDSREWDYDNWLSARNGKAPSFRPWLARVLHHAGLHVTAIDYGCLQGEPYECYARDLFEEDSLKKIPDGSIDIAHSRLLFSSPQLERIVNKRRLPLNGDDDFIQKYESIQKKMEDCDSSQHTAVILAQALEPQVARVLATDGVYITDSWPLEKGILSVKREEGRTTYLTKNQPKPI